MRDNHPKDWKKALKFDRSVRTPGLVKLYGTETFVHKSLVPLGEADLSPSDEEMYDQECEGNCGV
jgi:hypothetical protein